MQRASMAEDCIIPHTSCEFENVHSGVYSVLEIAICILVLPRSYTRDRTEEIYGL